MIEDIKFTFGKYKNWYVWDVVEKDVNYIWWLYYDTEWFKEKYPEIYLFLKENWDFWMDIYHESTGMSHCCDYD